MDLARGLAPKVGASLPPEVLDGVHCRSPGRRGARADDRGHGWPRRCRSVTCKDGGSAVAGDATKILLRWYEKDGAAPGAAVLYLHGGGMIMGSVALYDGPVAQYV